MTRQKKIRFILFTAFLIIVSWGNLLAQSDSTEIQSEQTENDLWGMESDTALDERVEAYNDSGLLELNPSRIESPNPNYLRSKGAGNNPAPSGNGVYDVGSSEYGTMPQDVISEKPHSTRE